MQITAGRRVRRKQHVNVVSNHIFGQNSNKCTGPCFATVQMPRKCFREYSEKLLGPFVPKQLFPVLFSATAPGSRHNIPFRSGETERSLALLRVCPIRIASAAGTGIDMGNLEYLNTFSCECNEQNKMSDAIRMNPKPLRQ